MRLVGLCAIAIYGEHALLPLLEQGMRMNNAPV
ncbi:hypothetical protein EMIT0194MI4_70123 [Pseudomonas sp. IT-194MI4]